MAEDSGAWLLGWSVKIICGRVSNNNVAAAEIAGLIANVRDALAGLGAPVPEPESELKPAVSGRASAKHDHLVCLEDGEKLKMLKRHLSTRHQLTPTQYRTRWNLPADYPMVAPDYAERRRSLAIEIALGRKPSPKRKAPSKRK